MGGVIRTAAEAPLDLAVIRPARNVGWIRKAVKHVAERIPVDPGPRSRDRATYTGMEGDFIKNGSQSKHGQAVRAELIGAFERIDREVRIATTPTDALFMAETLLCLECEGPVLECGCFDGGSTAKLSLVAKTVGRELVVFDSFGGLPRVDADELSDLHARRSLGEVQEWTAGSYAAGVDVVTANVEKYGEIAVTTFWKGWSKDTLTDTNLPSRVALAFTDVDVVSAAKECLLALWPRLSEGGVLFSHDVGDIKVLQAPTDERLRREVLGEPVPIVFGADYGLCDAS